MKFVLIFGLTCLLAGFAIDMTVGETRAEQVVGFAYVMIAVSIVLSLFTGLVKLIFGNLVGKPIVFYTVMFVLVILSYNIIGYYAFEKFPTIMLLSDGFKMDFETPQISHFVIVGSYLITVGVTSLFNNQGKK